MLGLQKPTDINTDGFGNKEGTLRNNENDNMEIRNGTKNFKTILDESVTLVKENGKKSQYYCNLCQCDLHTVGAKNTHVQGRKHFFKLSEKILPNLKLVDPEGEEYVQIVRGQGKGASYHCSLCKCPISGTSCKWTHLEGRQHLRKLFRKLMEDPQIFDNMTVRYETGDPVDKLKNVTVLKKNINGTYIEIAKKSGNDEAIRTWLMNFQWTNETTYQLSFATRK